jgi:uncharacterized DUF497 family protein
MTYKGRLRSEGALSVYRLDRCLGLVDIYSVIHYIKNVAHFKFVYWLAEWVLVQSGFHFEWDDGNRHKSKLKHGVAPEEVEEVFEQTEDIRVLGEQIRPIVPEPRFGLLGLSKRGRHLFVCFTFRGTGIRIISARDMNKKEKQLYAKLCEE